MSTIPAAGAVAGVTAASGMAGAADSNSAQSPQVNQKVWKAAQDFEAMTINQLLEPMFSTLDGSGGFFGGGAGEQSFRPMLVTEMAKAVEQRGGLGLAQPIYEQMLKMQEKPR